MIEKEKIIIEPDENYLRECAGPKRSKRALFFLMNGECYCANASDVLAVIQLEKLTKIPESPEFIVGITNIRGEIVPLINLRSFLGLPQKEISAGAMVIVSDVTGHNIGLLVDKVDRVIDIDLDAVEPTLATIKGELAQYTDGQICSEGRICAIIDLKRILTSKKLDQLKTGDFI